LKFAPRRWQALLTGNDLNEFDRLALLLTSYLALFAAATGLWVLLPGP
jgi:hypothetical protein